MKINEAMDKIMEKATPLLQKLSMIFGKKTTLTLLVQVEGQPGCLVLSPSSQPLGNLMKALEEAEKIAGEAQSNQPNEAT